MSRSGRFLPEQVRPAPLSHQSRRRSPDRPTPGRAAAGNGPHVSVRNGLPVSIQPGPGLPGSGAGLLGLQERVTLAGGTLVHGPDGDGDFVVDAELRWEK